MEKVKNIVRLALLIAMIFAMEGCAQVQPRYEDSINLISREAGSGTRDAFTALTGIKEAGRDNTAITSEITSSTFVVISSVAGDEKAIGYVSLGTLAGKAKDKVKALSIEGTAPTAQNIKSGTYPLARSFIAVQGKNTSQTSLDFLEYILSQQGQELIEKKGYVPAVDQGERQTYQRDRELEGRIVIAGSTSVAPVIETLAESYKELHPKVKIEIQQTGSGAGIISVTQGACHLAISSRELREEEEAKGITATQIALDGIVVIVNKSNQVKDMSLETIKEIFTGNITRWGKVRVTD